MLILIPAQFHHRFGVASGPYYITVVVYRLAVKLNQAAAHTLAEVQSKALILLYMGASGMCWADAGILSNVSSGVSQRGAPQAMHRFMCLSPFQQHFWLLS